MAGDDAGYNGWTNYETWNLAFWLDNDQGSQEYWREQTVECFRNAEPYYNGQSKEDAAVQDLAEALEAEVKDAAPELDNGFYGDILNAAISTVNFREIARNWIGEAAQDAEPEEAEA